VKATTAESARCYSYVRFSTVEQAKGDSLRRQTKAAARFAAEHGLELDEDLTFRDLGRSAYAGHHATKGRLGEFLTACREGLVPRGSVLLVEAVDRLTRMDHIEAVNLIGELVKHVDLHVVQLGRTFTDNMVRHDMGAIFQLVGAVTLGHMESRQKGDRVGAAWQEKRISVAKDGGILTRKCPNWLRVVGDGDAAHFETVPERVAVVVEMFERFAAGESMETITRDLNERKVPPFGRGRCWYRSYVGKILRSESVVGVLEMGRKRRSDARRVIVESRNDYFPAIIAKSLFVEVQNRMKAGPSGRPTLRNQMQGVLRCPHCGGLVVRQDKGKRARPKLVCGAVRDGTGTDECKTMRIDFETYWGEFRADQRKEAERGAKAFDPRRVAIIRRKVEKSVSDLEELRENVATVPHPSRVLIEALTKLENEVAGQQKELRELSRSANLSWNALALALSDDEAEPGEVSARLKACYPDGIVMEVKP